MGQNSRPCNVCVTSRTIAAPCTSTHQRPFLARRGAFYAEMSAGANCGPMAPVRSTPPMPNLLAQAINCDDPDRAAKIIRDALASRPTKS
jgi:hypothetical protein